MTADDDENCTESLISNHMILFLEWLYSPLLGLGRFSVPYSSTISVGSLNQGSAVTE
jgi:hypothetical protein